MTTKWTGRTTATSDWSNSRLGGAYLEDETGDLITTETDEEIIIFEEGCIAIHLMDMKNYTIIYKTNG